MVKDQNHPRDNKSDFNLLQEKNGRKKQRYAATISISRSRAQVNGPQLIRDIPFGIRGSQLHRVTALTTMNMHSKEGITGVTPKQLSAWASQDALPLDSRTSPHWA